MKEVDVALARCASTQHALVHHRQALELGMTRRQIQSRVAAGLLVRLHRCVYRLGGAPTSPEQALLAACLAAGRGAVASHRGAAWLWRLRGFDGLVTEITVPAGQPCLSGVVVHRTRALDPVDVSRRQRVPVTTPARTLLDLGAVVDQAVMEAALEDALLRGLVSCNWVAKTLERLGGPGRRGCGVLRSLVETRDPATGATESRLEDQLLRVLRRASLPEPARQHAVGGVRLDFAYPDHRLGIEADSRTWHGGRDDVQRNSDKANLLLAHGWRVLHFTWADVRDRPRYVVECVAREVCLACPA